MGDSDPGRRNSPIPRAARTPRSTPSPLPRVLPGGARMRGAEARKCPSGREIFRVRGPGAQFRVRRVRSAGNTEGTGMALMSPAEILAAAGPMQPPAAAQVARWRALITAQGFGLPVVLGADGRLVAGLSRVLAAQELGLAQVPVARLGERRPQRRGTRRKPVGFDPKAGGLGILGSMVWRPAVYARGEVAWVSARAWREASKPEDLAALKAAKAARDPAVLAAAAAEVATVLRRLRGDWADHAVAPVPCGHSGTGDCFGRRLAQQVAGALGAGFVQLWEDRPVAGVSHPARNARLPGLDWVARPSGPVLVIDDVATTGAHLEEALGAARAAGVPALGAVWISGDVR